jgi:hypothetical protein
MVKKMKSPRRLAALAVFAIVAMSAFGFAAANTFPDEAGSAGIGDGDVSGFEVTAVGYGLQNNDPTYINEVHFTLDEAASEVHVRFYDGVGATGTPSDWFPCTESGTDISCDIPTLTVEVADVFSLEVSAVS